MAYVPGSPTHLLVGNPTAQSGKNAARIALAAKMLEDRGMPCEVLPTAPGGRTIGLVRDALNAGSYLCVVSMGGDGTFREVAAGLVESSKRYDVLMGMLPTGTANDQGRSFGLSSDEGALATNVAVLRAAHETWLDAGQIAGLDFQGRETFSALFFDSAGFGLSARVLTTRNLDRRLVEKVPGLKHVYRDQAVYAGALLKNFAGSYIVSDKFTAHIEADGRHFSLTRLSDLVIKATRVYGGAWVFDPTSKHDDGLFEIVPARGRRDWASRVVRSFEKSIVPGEALQIIGISPSEITRAAHMDIRFEVPHRSQALAAQIDGEEFPASARVRIDVIPRALRLIIP